MEKVRLFASLSVGIYLLASCADLGIKSNIFPVSVEVHNRDSIDFYRASPLTDGRLGDGLGARPLTEDSRLVGLATSGGGARAAAYTLGILAELQTLHPNSSRNALEEVDFISSNSGGSWGIAAYLSDRRRSGGASNLQARRADLIGRFRRASDGRILCWASRFTDAVTDGLTYEGLYNGGDWRPPATFFNASILPAQYPFVFSEAFLRHYQTRELGACGRAVSASGQMADLPIGFAAASSGSVPGFYASYARTGLCDDDDGAARTASFCNRRLSGGQRNALHIVDGGLYDNIGFRTAYEIFHAHRQSREIRQRALIIINSTFDTSAQTVAGTGSPGRFLGGILMGMGFPGQDAAFDRLHRPMLNSVGVDDVVLLDFVSTSGFREEQAPLLTGLEELAEFAALEVDCFGPDGRISERRARPRGVRGRLSIGQSLAVLRAAGGDCLSTNFYRAGTLSKTTYLADPGKFMIMWQLGQLSVRMNAAQIRAVLSR